MSSGEWHSACVLTVRRRGSQIVGTGAPLRASQLGLMARPLVLAGSRTISPGAGDHGCAVVRFLARSWAALMPRYKKRCSPWPTWFCVPSQASQPTVQPLLNQ